MQLFSATFVKNKCNFFRFLVLQKLAIVMTNIAEGTVNFLAGIFGGFQPRFSHRLLSGLNPAL